MEFRDNFFRAVSWFPSTVAGTILLLIVMWGISWWITGRLTRERDLTTTLFRIGASAVVLAAIFYFRDSFTYFVRHGPMMLFRTQSETEARLRQNMPQWMTPEAIAAYWAPPALTPEALKLLPAPQRQAYEATRVTPEVMVESALRGLVWLALEQRHSTRGSGRSPFPHAERGTKVLNQFTPMQAQAMFDFVVMIDPRCELDAVPYLKDALKFCMEPLPTDDPSKELAISGVHSGEPGNAAAAPAKSKYPFISASRETAGRKFYIVRLSAAQTKMIEAASEEEALRKAREYMP